MSKKGKNPEMSTIITIDTPVYYDLSEIRAKMQYLDTEKVTTGAIVKDGAFYGKFTRFLVRLDGKLNDPRYAFMFRPKKYIQSTTFNDLLTKILGADENAKVTVLDSKKHITICRALSIPPPLHEKLWNVSQKKDENTVLVVWL
jgi:hypothetical protein